MKLFLLLSTRNALRLLAFHVVSCSEFDKPWPKEGSYQPRPWLHFFLGTRHSAKGVGTFVGMWYISFVTHLCK